MKKRIFAMMALAAALCGCQKENLLPQEVNEGLELVFTATMEESPASKATYDSENRCAAWEEGDKININGKIYSAQEAGLTTSFKAVTEGQEAEGPAYKAYFPASLYNGKLPAIQTYTAGKFDMPMYAESTTTSLEFKNLCAVLAIKVTSEDIATLKSIKVASDKKMNGSFNVTDKKAALGEDGTNVVVLESADALTLTEEGTTFYIAIPAQDYQYLNIFLSSDGTTYTQAMATKKAAGLGDIARNTIFNIDYKKNATKLWEGDLFFADCNVGAGSPSEYGGYYTWGGTYFNGNGIPWLDDHNEGTDILTGEHDTATALWGTNWRMPTKDELFSFLCTDGKCESEWTEVNGVNGFKFTGKETYSGNSVFLPAAGECDDLGVDESEQGNIGCYWTLTPCPLPSDPERKSEAIVLTVLYANSAKNIGSSFRYIGSSVRAVLMEAENPSAPEVPEGALPGEFTVNAEGKKVFFSQGNLYYDGSKFNFETNQYDFQSSWSAEHVCHFYWSKDASVASAEKYADSAVSTSDVFFTNATETTPSRNFTVNVGGNPQNGWRTLSKSEWYYLLCDREVNGGTPYDFGNYGGKFGIFIYPDGYTGARLPETVETLPEGVVFLPAAGVRNSSDQPADMSDKSTVISYPGEVGRYWTSSVENDLSKPAAHTGVSFDLESITFASAAWNYRNEGTSVRLVKDVK